jgi:hypothetical protein
MPSKGRNAARKPKSGRARDRQTSAAKTKKRDFTSEAYSKLFGTLGAPTSKNSKAASADRVYSLTAKRHNSRNKTETKRRKKTK